MSRSRPKILAIASGGGHWVQLLRLRSAFEGCDVVYATAKEGYRADVGEASFHVIVDFLLASQGTAGRRDIDRRGTWVFRAQARKTDGIPDDLGG
jgi:hypothetical protein